MLRIPLAFAFYCAVSSSALAQQPVSGLPGWVSTDSRTIEACTKDKVATISLRYHITYHGESGLSSQNSAAIDAFIQEAWAKTMEEQTVELAPEQNDFGYDDPDIVKRMDEISLSTLVYKTEKSVRAIFKKAVDALLWTGKRPAVSGGVFNLVRGCDL